MFRFRVMMISGLWGSSRPTQPHNCHDKFFRTWFDISQNHSQLGKVQPSFQTRLRSSLSHVLALITVISQQKYVTAPQDWSLSDFAALPIQNLANLLTQNCHVWSSKLHQLNPCSSWHAELWVVNQQSFSSWGHKWPSTPTSQQQQPPSP